MIKEMFNWAYQKCRYEIFLKSRLLSVIRSKFQLPDTIKSLEEAYSILVARRRSDLVRSCASLDNAEPISEFELEYLKSFQTFNLSAEELSNMMNSLRRGLDKWFFIDRKWREARCRNIVERCIQLDSHMTLDLLRDIPIFQDMLRLAPITEIDYEKSAQRIGNFLNLIPNLNLIPKKSTGRIKQLCQIFDTWKQIYLANGRVFDYCDYSRHTRRLLYDDLRKVGVVKSKGLWRILLDAFIKD